MLCSHEQPDRETSLFDVSQTTFRLLLRIRGNLPGFFGANSNRLGYTFSTGPGLGMFSSVRLRYTFKRSGLVELLWGDSGVLNVGIP